MSTITTLTILLSAAVGVTSQSVSVNCGSTPRNTVISDDRFQADRIRNTVFPALRDTLCAVGQDSYCAAVGNSCQLNAQLLEDGQEVTVSFTKVLANSEVSETGRCSEVIVGQIYLVLQMCVRSLVFLGSNNRAVHRRLYHNKLWFCKRGVYRLFDIACTAAGVAQGRRYESARRNS